MMKALVVVGSLYLAIGCFTLWFVAQMPWFLTLREWALSGLLWPLFWWGYLRQ